ncbi:vacuolar fusion protein CCZ1 isoform X1 [Dermatophagoides pteronyssinus]|uniref:Vacuolar fusion protein CCZ1 homolog isoform X1 n=1 Tax=Dermatophagoides pteronyssinus TaxID=6956 RepID=A0A6P6Y7K2_DERPT|nr:vacuolar fusion protein CCZ1 homolog isoform X1 [Dermatophagoides pteronyssinus]
MSQVKIRHPIQLIKYFVFNTKWGSKEGNEHEKLIYYYHKPTLVIGIDQKISDVGLAEAVINFGRQFGDITESLQGDRLRFIFHELADDFWSSMFISESYSVHKSGEDSTQIAEYHENEICDNFFKLKLENIYNYFRLLNGPINELCSKLSRQEFLDKCQDFFDNYIPNIELLPFNLIELYSSIQYLPLSNNTFMAVQSLLNCVQANDSRIDSYIFIYNDQLVSSSLSLFDTQILYNYLTNIIIPDAVKEEISGISNKTRWLQVNIPVYLIGHPDCHQSKFGNLCLFRSINGSTIGLILTEFDENILKECGTLLSGRLVSLTNKLHETVTQIAKQPDSKLSNDNSAKDIKFIYVNYSNCAQRGNSNCRKLIDSDFTRLIIDVESDLHQQQRFNDEQVFELIGKNMNDAWLVTRNSDCRSLFAMLNYKNANVIEASDMIDAMQNKHFKNLFFGI